MRARSATAVVLGAAVCAVAAMAFFDGRPLRWIEQQLRPGTPHQRYARLLAESGLRDTALGTEWLTASTRAVEHPVPVDVPFNEDAFIDPARPLSLGYALTLKRGQRLDVQIAVVTDTPGRVFVDLFNPAADDNRDTPAVASASNDSTSLSYEVNRPGTYVLRVQPELLRGGHLRIASQATASMRFPVMGGGALAMQSFYGDARDAGRRTHEGVDIFAPRGTPVVAASDGVVARVGENTLGGRVVWLWDLPRGIRLYYAHLQEQSVRAGAFVHAGDVLGTVGNTGNARTTSPHLHFGIYTAAEGAIDPAPFIRPSPAAGEPHTPGTSVLGQWRYTRTPAPLRSAPSSRARVLDTLPRASAVRVEGTLGRWVRIGTREHINGFLDVRQLY